MAWNDCYGYNFNTGACINYGDTHIYPGTFHGYQGGQNGPGGGNSPDPGNNLPQNGPVANLSGGGQGVGAPFSVTPITQALGLTNDGIWWLVVIGITVLVVSGSSARSRR